jgi:serine protease Do
MENGRQLQVNLYGRPIGDVVALSMQRGERQFEASVTVVERDDDPGRFEAFAKPEDHVIARLGVLGLSLTREVAALLPDLRSPKGVVVAATSRDVPPSWEGDLAIGDVIHAANGTPTPTVQELRRIVDGLPADAALVLDVERDGGLRYVAGRVE